MSNVTAMSAHKLDLIDQIKEWIKNPPENSRVITFTPKIAAEILGEQIDGDKVGLNTHNRHKKPKKVKEYSEDMTDGDWKFTGDTVKFCKSGALGDGQNRLYACIRSRKSFKTHVVFGIEDAIFPWFDKGKPRSLGDDFETDALENPQLLAHVMRWLELIRLDEVKARTTFDRSVLRDKYFDGTYDKALVSRATSKGLAVQKANPTPRAFASAMYYNCALLPKNKELADKFFDAWSTGTNPKGFGAIKKANAFLVKAKNDGVRINEVMRAFVWFTAWNLVVDGLTGTLKSFEYSAKDAFPKIR